MDFVPAGGLISIIISTVLDVHLYTDSQSYVKFHIFYMNNNDIGLYLAESLVNKQEKLAG